MDAMKQTRKLIVSRFDGEQGIFYLKPQNEDTEEQAVACKISLQGTANGHIRSVNINLALTDYEIVRFTNPYLDAENDLFKLKIGDKSIGYIIPYSSIEDSDGIVNEEFDEQQQAYKYYCVKAILEQTLFDKEATFDPIPFSKLVNTNSIFVIIYKRLIIGSDFKIEDYLPSFALRGYYYYPDTVRPNVSSLTTEMRIDPELSSLIDSRFLTCRNNESIKISAAENIVGQNPMMQLLYKKLLTESGNPLHRFLILYQVIEFLVDKKIRSDIDLFLQEQNALTNFKFVQRIHELNNTRSTINKIFEEVKFDEKAEITNALRDFILIFDSTFKSQATGDCIYDIRNLLFHDFKSVLEKNMDGAVTSLVIQCEIMIHQLLISLGQPKFAPEATALSVPSEAKTVA